MWPSAARIGYLPGGIAFWDNLTGERLLDELAALSGRPPVLRGAAHRPARARRRGAAAPGPRPTRAGCARRSASSRRSSTIRSWPSSTSRPRASTRSCSGPSTTSSTSGSAAGRTIFFSSHVLSEVERVCDRVAIIRHGRLAAVEDVADLLARRRRTVELRFDGPAPALDGRRRRQRPRRRGRSAHLPPGRRGRAVPGGDRRDDRARPDHRAGQPRGGVPRVLRG